MSPTPLFDQAERERLAPQYAKVWALMQDGQWRTLREISDATNAPEASASARLREIDEAGKGNGWAKVKRLRNGVRGHYEYKVSYGDNP